MRNLDRPSSTLGQQDRIAHGCADWVDFNHGRVRVCASAVEQTTSCEHAAGKEHCEGRQDNPGHRLLLLNRENGEGHWTRHDQVHEQNNGEQANSRNSKAPIAE